MSTQEHYVPKQIDNGIWYASLPFPRDLDLYSFWVITPEGVVVIDTGANSGEKLLAAIRQTTRQPIRYIIYTHGHFDHIGGAPELMEDKPVIIGHENVAARMDRYARMAPFIARINETQYSKSSVIERSEGLKPTLTYHNSHSFRLGGERFELVHAKGETDDHTMIHMPDRGIVFPGDIILGVFPNLGNPYKVQRYAKEWYEAIDLMLSWRPKVVAAAHVIIQGEEIGPHLAACSEVLRFIEDSVVAGINAGKTLEQLWEEIKLPEHLANNKFLKPSYSNLRFGIYNVYKRYCGYYDFNPAHMLPRPSWEVSAAIREIAGDDARILKKAHGLMAEGELHLALHVLDLVLANEYSHRKARQLRRDVLARLVEEEPTLMSRGAYRHALQEDETFLAVATAPVRRLPSAAAGGRPLSLASGDFTFRSSD